MKKISVLIPCYNEQENVEAISKSGAGDPDTGSAPVRLRAGVHRQRLNR